MEIVPVLLQAAIEFCAPAEGAALMTEVEPSEFVRVTCARK